LKLLTAEDPALLVGSAAANGPLSHKA
jgi:hypothetical protein